MRLATICILWTLTMFGSALAADDCKAVLANGVWEYQINESDTHNVSAFLNWYGAQASGQSSSSKRQSLTGSTVYEGAPLSIGLSNEAQENDQFFSSLETLSAGFSQYDSRVVNFVKTASPVIVKAWTDCMNSTAGGLHASIRYTGNERELIVHMKYQPIEARTKTRVTIDEPSNLKCASRKLAVNVVGTSIRCARSTSAAGAIILHSDTIVIPEDTLRFPVARFNLTGQPYATCDVIEEIKTGDEQLDPAAEGMVSGDDIGGGKAGTALALEVPIGYRLTNVVPHCAKLDCDNPCAFVRNLDVQWTIPGRRAVANPSTDSCRVTVSLTGTKQKVIVVTTRQTVPAKLKLAFGKSASVELPNTALDVKLYCDADGAQRIFSLSDIEAKNDQLYLKDKRTSPTGSIFDIAVLPYRLPAE